MHTLLCVLYFAVLLLLASYGIHRSHLVWQCWRYRRRLTQAKMVGGALAPDAELPVVTIQLPLFNEATVAVRLLEAVAKMDYPREKLEIQILDDSTDETQALARATVERIRRTGVDMVYIHRTDRTGYKAGALDAGLTVAKGELVAIFDADFLPPPDFLRHVVSHFQNDSVGMVQTRWGHLNRDHSLLTQVQALMLDGHHLVENRARFAAGNLFNFSGTGGIWRKRAIVEAGGWQHDTLTEDLDLSYRAQLAGWRFVYRDDVVSPAELPEDVSAFRAQQFRWAKGTVQTSRKLLRRVVLGSKLSLGQRLEAFFHLTPHFAYPLMIFLSVLLLPALVFMPATDAKTMILVDLPLVIGTTGSLATFYALAESAQGRSRLGALVRLPMLIALGAGLAPHLTKAVFEGLGNMAGEFVRTPKKGLLEGRYRARAALPLAEIGLSALSLLSVIASVQTRHYFATPFAMLFCFGYGYVALLVASEQLLRRREGHSIPPVESEKPATETPLAIDMLARLAERSGCTGALVPHGTGASSFSTFGGFHALQATPPVSCHARGVPPRTVALKTDVLQPGAVLSGKFRVERVIGAGGMGMVVAAFHLQLERRVALKFLLPEMLRSEDIVARFFREAKAAAKIQSEHVVRVLDVGTLDNGAPYMVMEYLEGRDLSEVLKARGPLPVADAVLYVLQACEALAEAHRAGIVHRDLKPANLFLSQRPDGSATVKVLDFGISKATLLSDPVDTALTREASTLGSPAYMSPEQLRSARDVDPRTDVWSLGVVLHELLTGVTAFQASTLPELHVAILAQPPSSVRVRRPDVPPGLESVIARCLEKDPRARFSNVGELAAALADFSPQSGLLHVERASRTAGGTRAPYGASVPPTMQSPPGAGPAIPQAPPAPQLPPFGATYPQASPVTVPGAPLGANALVPHGVPYGGHTPQPSLDPLGPRAPSAGMTLAWIAIILVVGFVVVFGGACVVCAGIVGAS